MDESTETLLRNLRLCGENKNTSDTLKVLEEISDGNPDQFSTVDITEQINTLLTSDVNIKCATCKCIAELSKNEEQRQKFSNLITIKTIISHCLQSNGSKCDDYNELSEPNIQLLIQGCRALGNICYQNDNATSLIMSNKLDEDIINLLNIKNDLSHQDHRKFMLVRGGLISNYLTGSEDIAKRAIDLSIIEKTKKLIDAVVSNGMSIENQELIMNLLLSISILTEQVSDLNFDDDLNKKLVLIFKSASSKDLIELCLEMLQYQAENDDVKLLLVQNGLCDVIYEMMTKHKSQGDKTEEERGLMKLACDVIVLLLTGDTAMEVLYASSFLSHMIEWLDSEDNDLLTTGVLALGNFARTDKHCIDMVQNRVVDKLLKLLTANNSEDVKLQHAILSTLRNLVIPKENKTAMIKVGLVDLILPMLETHQQPVVFKLLGTLRMLIDGQQTLSIKLLRNEKLLEQLVEWGQKWDFAAVTGESLRLMAWLVKHASQIKTPSPSNAEGKEIKPTLSPSPDIKDALAGFVKVPGTITCMVNMLLSQHLVMQNEALIVLTLLVGNLCNTNVQSQNVNIEEQLIKDNLGQRFEEFLKKGADTMTKEIVENINSFVTIVRKNSEKLQTHFAVHNIDALVTNLPVLKEYCIV